MLSEARTLLYLQMAGFLSCISYCIRTYFEDISLCVCLFCREVHVWYLCPDELDAHSQLKMYKELLDPAENKYADSSNQC